MKMTIDDMIIIIYFASLIYMSICVCVLKEKKNIWKIENEGESANDENESHRK